ncbi:hypothetical protein ACFLXE_05380 [Chloroflexota bacterium]
METKEIVNSHFRESSPLEPVSEVTGYKVIDGSLVRNRCDQPPIIVPPKKLELLGRGEVGVSRGLFVAILERLIRLSLAQAWR